MHFDLSKGKKVVFAFSSRALFDLEKEHAMFDPANPEAYEKYQYQRRNKTLKPGVALSFAYKLLSFNDGLEYKDQPVSCVVISRSDPYTGQRVHNSLIEYGMGQICARVNTGGSDPVRYLEAYRASLFLTADEVDARAALARGHAAALIYPRRGKEPDPADRQLRLGLDFDGVLGSDESDRIAHEQGLEAYFEHEQKKVGKIMPSGPFRGVAGVFNQLRQAGAPIRTTLITGRVSSSNDRALLSLKRWGVQIDEMVTTGSTPKGPFVKASGVDFFAEDTPHHALDVAPHTLVAHVVHGVRNEKKLVPP